MDRKQIAEKLKHMLQARFGIPVETIEGHTRRAEMGIDSILMLDFILDIETELDLTFDNLNMPPNPSLDEVVDLICANLPATPG